MALARHFLETWSIEDRDDTARVTDQTALLEHARGERDGRPAYTQHLGQKLMRQRQGVTFESIATHQ